MFDGWSEAQTLTQRERANNKVAWGVALIVVGAGLTIATHASASAGRVYFISYGLLIFGGVRLVQGIVDASATHRMVAIAVAVMMLATGIWVFSA